MTPIRAAVRASAALIAATLVVPLLSTPTGAVSVSESFTVPASGSFTIVGHGFGHGHGMSQYGANGAALKGLKHEGILSFYYPGTALAKTAGWLRVLISAHTGTDLVVLAQPGLILRDRGTNKDYPLPTNLGATKWRLTVDGAASVVDYKSDVWHRYRPGGLAVLTGDGAFRVTSGTLTLVTSSGNRVYRDQLNNRSPAPGSTGRVTVNSVTLDNYVKGVVPAEMPASWSPEAVQAQAVAARTYAWWSQAPHPDRYYQICDTSSCQVYKGYAGEHPAANAAVDATRGQILRYGGEPAFTQFSASSGGRTSAGGFPYLPSKGDPYDAWTGNSVHDWSVKVSETTLEKRYPGIGDLKKIKVTSREGGGEWNGRVWNVTLVGGSASKVVTGSDLRSVYGLRSTYFTFR